jgi:hypothetical protein
MDRELWTVVMASIHSASRAVIDCGRRPTWPNWLIVAMELWRVWHGRTLSWACDRTHYGDLFRPRKRTSDGRCLPSISQFSRRVKCEAVQWILQRVDNELSGRCINTGAVRFVDGKALAVSPVSKDPDATSGHVAGGWAKGYKLHAFVGADRRIQVWSVVPLNTSELTVAAEMLPYLRPAAAGVGLTLGDSYYDAAPLHKAVDAATGDRLLTPLKSQQRVGPDGRHPETLRRMGPLRREALELWEEFPALAKSVLKQRNNIEGVFSVLTVACNLALPACVRRLERVRRWVGVKIILYHARLHVQERDVAA